ncbi:response regulator [Acuticoccus sp. I52.16.1]|uniref:response regulator n=1 Tax=Acuticoccus sp. I52.16.1 TaxID=2928472 RepID=UPI001FD53C98|nr:response regulator [Acuticoccus sp. I52.16.1]UOM32770.1 response regulator [Acuticoccus sp. I52.16.1]
MLLLVEDNPADAILMEEAMSGRGIDLVVVEGGNEACDYVCGRRPYQDAPRPDLIVLDLNLPDMSGKDVLATVKSGVDTRTIPVVIFSSSRSQSDVVETYELGANSYMQKPLELEAYRDVVHSLEKFWFSAAQLPPSAQWGTA